MTQPGEPTMGTLLVETLRAIRACLCVQLEQTMAGKVCRCAIMPGAQPIADICDRTPYGEGQGWVRLTRRFLFDTFPLTLTELSTCGVGQPGIEVEIGVLRCDPSPDENGEPPTGEELEAAAIKVADDSEALMWVARCCLPNKVRRVVGEWEPLSGGGCTGGTVTFAVEILPRGLEEWR